MLVPRPGGARIAPFSEVLDDADKTIIEGAVSAGNSRQVHVLIQRCTHPSLELRRPMLLTEIDVPAVATVALFKRELCRRVGQQRILHPAFQHIVGSQSSGSSDDDTTLMSVCDLTPGCTICVDVVAPADSGYDTAVLPPLRDGPLEEELQRLYIRSEAPKAGTSGWPVTAGAAVVPKRRQQKPRNRGKGIRGKWTSEQVVALVDAMEEHGTSSWAVIAASGNRALSNYDETALRDKYRNLKKASQKGWAGPMWGDRPDEAIQRRIDALVALEAGAKNNRGVAQPRGVKKAAATVDREDDDDAASRWSIGGEDDYNEQQSGDDTVQCAPVAAMSKKAHTPLRTPAPPPKDRCVRPTPLGAKSVIELLDSDTPRPRRLAGAERTPPPPHFILVDDDGASS